MTSSCRLRAAAAGAVLAALLPTATVAQDFLHLELPLNGPPVALLSADLNGDGRTDLLAVTAFTYWGQESQFVAETLPDGRPAQMVEVVPVLVDRREMRLYLATGDGGFVPAAPAQELPHSILALDQGPAAQPILALADSGVVAVRYRAGEIPPLSLEPILSSSSVLAGTGQLIPLYRFTADLDGDGQRDLMLPRADGLSLHLAGHGSLQSEPAAVLQLPGDVSGRDGVAWRRYPLPRIQEINGDADPDLVLFHQAEPGTALIKQGHGSDLDAISVLPGLGDGRYGDAVALSRPLTPGQSTPAQELQAALAGGGAASLEDGLGDPAQIPGRLGFFGDLDGDGKAELVSYQEEKVSGKRNGLRQEMRETKHPRFRYRFYRLDAALQVGAEPYLELTAEGYPFDFDFLQAEQGGFVDLNGDGLLDMVTVSLDFSLWQAPKILISRTVGAGLEFHVHLQDDRGRFQQVRDGRLTGKIKVNLSESRLSRMSQFAGDFDGDGRVEFLHVGGGRVVNIHRGTAAGLPEKEPVRLRLAAGMDDAGRVRVLDIDGDGRSDLMVVTPLPAAESGATRPHRLDLYLAREAQ